MCVCVCVCEREREREKERESSKESREDGLPHINKSSMCFVALAEFTSGG